MGALASGVVGCVAVSRRSLLVSAATGRDGQHWFAALDDTGNLAFQAQLPGRGHEAVVSPDRRTAFLPARRPGDWAAMVDLRDGRVVEICHAARGRHFYGHGVFSPSGDVILTPENDFERGNGVVVVRDARSLEVVGEFASGGVGPHEVKWLRDGVLAVANGGIRTHPGQPRKKLNLERMRPNLTLLDWRAATVIDQVEAPNPRASIRHIDVAGDRVVLAMQYEGAPTDDTPLVYLFDAISGTLEPLAIAAQVRVQMRQYVASICVDPATGRAMATAPHGHLVTYWDLREGCLSYRRVRDAGGVALDQHSAQFVVTNGAGAVMRFDAATGERSKDVRRYRGLRWDNHLTVV